MKLLWSYAIKHVIHMLQDSGLHSQDISHWNLITVSYNDYYLSLGFMYASEEIASVTLCILCNKVLPNSSMLLAKLYKHHDTNHLQYRDKNISFIRHKLEALPEPYGEEFKNWQWKGYWGPYRVSYHTALVGANFADTVILITLNIMTKILVYRV